MERVQVDPAGRPGGHAFTRRRIVLAIVVAGLLAIAAAVGSSRLTAEPIRALDSAADRRSAQEPVLEGAVALSLVIPDSDIQVLMPTVLPSTMTVQQAPGVLGLGDGASGLSCGSAVADQAVPESRRARGIVIAEVTHARSHGSLSGQQLGRDAASLIWGLRDVAGFAVPEPTSARFAGLPGVSARVSLGSLRGWTHIDRPSGGDGLDCVVEFSVPSRVTAVDIEGAVVLVQVWASDEADLKTWLPIADGLLEPIGITRE